MSDPPKSLRPPDDNSGFCISLKRALPRSLIPAPTLNVDETFLKALDGLPPGSKILNLGSGQELWDRKIRHKMVNMDIDLSRGRSDICADGHYLPFASQSFDAVFSNAVLEHVRKPWVVAAEIRRVVRMGGMVSINVPFLNIIHDVVDYYRFTADGLRVLFEDFEEVHAGVSAGPSSFYTIFFPEYVSQFMPFRGLRTLARYVLKSVIWPAKYLDFLIRRSDRFHVAADAFYFVGRRIR
jgi:SAM-dependent methyltransferase